MFEMTMEETEEMDTLPLCTITMGKRSLQIDFYSLVWF